MKTLVVLVCILFCMAVINANAQSVSEKYTYTPFIGYACDGTWDFISGPVTYHWITYYGNDGNVAWKKLQMHSAELVSLVTGEEFTLNYAQKQDAWGVPGSLMEYHYNLIGDLGTHLIFSVVFDISGGMTLVESKAKCL